MQAARGDAIKFLAEPRISGVSLRLTLDIERHSIVRGGAHGARERGGGMCGIDGGHEGVGTLQVGESGLRVADFDALLARARYVSELPELRNSHIGFVGYGQTKAGDRVLLAVD